MDKAKMDKTPGARLTQDDLKALFGFVPEGDIVSPSDLEDTSEIEAERFLSLKGDCDGRSV